MDNLVKEDRYVRKERGNHRKSPLETNEIPNRVKFDRSFLADEFDNDNLKMAEDMKITLSPMQIRTFIVEIQKVAVPNNE